MSRRKRQMSAKIIKSSSVQKAEQVTAVQGSNKGEVFLSPELDMRGLEAHVDKSAILPQCIQAYKNNIAGFGLDIVKKADVPEGTASNEEYDKIKQILSALSIETDLKEVFENVIEARETYGISYLEVIRNLAGEVVQVFFIKQTPAISKTDPLPPYVESGLYYDGLQQKQKRKFCKFKQEVNGITVYFKEFGDPRIMDNRTGQYVTELELDYQANEIIDFPIGTAPYGKIRWRGQLRGVDGSCRAENLNRNYFINGRHTPAVLVISGGKLTDKSYENLQLYMNDIRGENGQHSFLVLETEAADEGVDFGESGKPPTAEIKDLASILQKDELFQDYIDNNRKRVQSAFRLPDLYIGYTSDYNRSTSQMAQEVTEKQVFQPERKSLAWIINHKLLAGYGFKYWEVCFKAPEITNPDDLTKILTVAEKAGGITPNKAKEIAYEILGDTFEPFPPEYGDVPIARQTLLRNAVVQPDSVAKSADEHDQIYAIMKEVRNLLADKEGG